MSSRLQYFFRQKVNEAELNLGFDLLEKADRDLAADLGVLGVITGAVPVEHAPVADLTIDLTAPARAYDAAGRRLAFGTNQRIQCAVDTTGVPTDVSTAGHERWLAVFLKFDRLLAEPRTDGNSQQVFFRQDESFQIVVRQGPQAPLGAAPKVQLEGDGILLCDVRRRAGQTQIRNADLDLSRRQAFVLAPATALSVAPGTWLLVAPTVATVQASLNAVDAVIAGHVGGTAHRHAGTHVDYQLSGFLQTATNVQAAFDELMSRLGLSGNAPGTIRIGARAATGTPFALAAGTVDDQLKVLLGHVNTHAAAATGAHAASAIAATPHAFIGATQVQGQLQEIVADLAATAAAGSGASRIGVADAANRFTATDVEAALAEAAKSIQDGHFLSNEANGGQHRVVRQPAFAASGGLALLWDAEGVGTGASRFRVYADQESVWMVVNAGWSGTAWSADEVSSPSGGLRLGRSAFEVFHQPVSPSTPTWVTWDRRLRLPLADTVNSAFESAGKVQEVGRAGVHGSNSHTATRSIALGSSLTFRSRFAAAPSSVVLATIASSPGFTGLPTVQNVTRDGFSIRTTQSVQAGEEVFWQGSYTANA